MRQDLGTCGAFACRDHDVGVVSSHSLTLPIISTKAQTRHEDLLVYLFVRIKTWFDYLIRLVLG